MLRRKQNTGKKMAVSAVIAGVVGYVSGLLTAPKSCKKWPSRRPRFKQSCKAGQTSRQKSFQIFQSLVFTTNWCNICA
jgi:gas vesicle protein